MYSNITHKIFIHQTLLLYKTYKTNDFSLSKKFFKSQTLHPIKTSIPQPILPLPQTQSAVPSAKPFYSLSTPFAYNNSLPIDRAKSLHCTKYYKYTRSLQILQSIRMRAGPLPAHRTAGRVAQPADHHPTSESAGLQTGLLDGRWIVAIANGQN